MNRLRDDIRQVVEKEPMGTPIGILTIHGMGEQTADFDRGLRKALLARLNDHVRADVRFQSVHYQPAMQKDQEDIWGRMVRKGVRWRWLRKLFLYYFSDATTYQYKPEA